MILLHNLKQFTDVEWLYPRNHAAQSDFNHFDSQTLGTFMSNECIDFFSGFSTFILGEHYAKNKQLNADPILVSLGFWLRKANLANIAKNYLQESDSQEKRQPLGTVFQVAPNNIDTLFFYSMVMGLLTGNKVVVRLGNTSSPIASVLIELFITYCDESGSDVGSKALSNKMSKTTSKIFSDTRNRIALIKYPRNDEISSYLVQHAEGLVVWGGDSTVRYFDELTSIKPEVHEKHSVSKEPISTLYFPDRYSIALLGKLKDEQLELAARAFVTDVQAFNQQACASPRVVVWMPNVTDSSKNQFWRAVEACWQKAPPVSLSLAEHVNVNVFTQYLHMTGRTVASKQHSGFNLVDMGEIQQSDLDSHCGNFVFMQQHLTELDELNSLLQPKLQGVSTFAISRDEQQTIYKLKGGKNIRRWVELGQSLQFSHVWDGVDLGLGLSNKIYNRFIYL